MYGYVDSKDVNFNYKKFYTFSEVIKIINKKEVKKLKLLKLLRTKGILNECNIAREDLIKDGVFNVNYKNLYPGCFVNSTGVSKKGIELIKLLLNEH